MQEFNEDITVYNNIAVGGEVAANSIKLAGSDIIQAVANALWPVGSIYLTVSNTNPSGQFGGTWVAWGTGRVPVGVDTSQTEFNGVEKTGGEKTHILTVPELAVHDHSIYVAGSTGITRDVVNITYEQSNTTPISNPLTSTGENEPFNILQPYITCYMWKRTA